MTYGNLTRNQPGVAPRLRDINDMVDMAKYDNGRYDIRIVSSQQYEAIRQERLCEAYPDRGWLWFHIGNHADRLTADQERCRIRERHAHGHIIFQDQSEFEVCL